LIAVVFAFIGFGELGTCLAEQLSRGGQFELRAYAPSRASTGAAEALQERLERGGAQRLGSITEAVADARAVVSVVPSSAALQTAEACAPLLADGTLYVDLTAASLADTEAAAALFDATGADYVDGAVLGTVATSGAEVPIVLSGPGASRWQALVAPAGLRVSVIDAPAGRATLLKLLRSVYMKGRDALIVEMTLAARRYGLEHEVLATVKGPGESVPFPQLAERVLCALAVHAGRRADELHASSEVVAAAGIDPVISRAGSQVLRALADLELRGAFDHERAPSAAEVLAAIDERSGRTAPGDP
jgi:3-hydroxyisobutyrate dehydrogenase-like beta-hydroxyacid dehydrogenase